MSGFYRLQRGVLKAMLLDDSLDRLEEVGIAVRGPGAEEPKGASAKEAFSPKIQHQATRMRRVYEMFFCLENDVRNLLSQRLQERPGAGWWGQVVPQRIQKRVAQLKRDEERNKYHAKRSTQPVGYAMFGDLSDVILTLWDDFQDLFPNQQWIKSRFQDLEMSRNIIMHTNVLPDREIERIEWIVQDWVSQVG